MGRIKMVYEPLAKQHIRGLLYYNASVHRVFGNRPDLPFINEGGQCGETLPDNLQQDITNYSSCQLPDEKSIQLRHIMARHR